MALTQQSLTAVARRKTNHAKLKLINAERELASANEVLKEAAAQPRQQQIGAVRKQTEHAEQEVAEAVEELEVVSELLQTSLGADADASLERASGEGVKSLVAHMKKTAGG